MAKARKRPTSRRADGQTPVPSAELPPTDGGNNSGVETTGRFIVIMKDNGRSQPQRVKETLKNVAGIKEVAMSSDYEDGAIARADRTKKHGTAYFEKLGVAVVSDEEAVMALSASAANSDSEVLVIEPEYVAYPTESLLAVDYLRGYRDAVNHLFDALSDTQSAAAGVQPLAVSFRDTDQFTWGLQAIGAHTSRFDGRDIRVAVLDTGLDLNHPDYRGRPITNETFSGVPVQDTHGHGTHCVGTSCGPQRPASGVRRYGVAPAAQIFVGRVFDAAPRPRATTGDVIAGIEWAMTNGCRVVSLSLGIPINQKVQQYETPTKRALDAGTLIVAAAGNNAQRPGNPGFVEPPANADATLAVAAIDRHRQIASFSGRSSLITGVGGSVNIAGPGVAVFSSVPVTRGSHDTFNGTSMATPHVAGIAALWSQATGETGLALWTRIVQSAVALTLPSADVGAGLVQAP